MAGREVFITTMNRESAENYFKRAQEKKSSPGVGSAPAASTGDRKVAAETIVLEKEAAPVKQRAESKSRQAASASANARRDRENIQSSVRTSLARIQASFETHAETAAPGASAREVADSSAAGESRKQAARKPTAAAKPAVSADAAGNRAAEASAAAQREESVKKEKERLDKMIQKARAVAEPSAVDSRKKGNAGTENSIRNEEDFPVFAFPAVPAAARLEQLFDTSDAVLSGFFELISNAVDSAHNIAEELSDFSDDWLAENVAVAEKLMESHTPADIAARSEELARENVSRALEKAKRVVALTDKCNRKLEASCYRIGEEVEALVGNLRSRE